MLAPRPIQLNTPWKIAQQKAYRLRPEVKARLSYLQIPQVRLKRKLTRQRLGYTLNVNLKIVDHKTGTLKKKLTRKERKKLGWVGNFFAPGIAVGGLGLYGVSNKRGKR